MTVLRFFLFAILGAAAFAQHSTNLPAFADAAAGAKKFQLLPGLKLEVWAAEPQLSNAVAFNLDHRGRAFIAESDRWAISVFDITAHTQWLLQDMSFRTVADRSAFLSNQFATNLTLLTKDSEAIRLVEDRDGDGQADHSAIFATGFHTVADGTAAGILATGTNLYFGNIPNLWRFPAPGDSGSLSPRTPQTENLLAHGFGVHIGVSGHDLHGLIRGPDGRIYLSFGDRGVCLTNREGGVINLPDTGGVLRCEPDGRDLEVFCYGLRNPQELAFDDYGNLWTVDNDTAGADPCRVLHLVEGGDYGWRTSYQHMDGFGPWVQEELWKGGQDGILPLAGTVSQGPSGLAFYPGTGFGDRLNGKFLHADFPGGVWAFSVKPKGASYEVDTKEKFLWNCWPTDVDFGPDGAAYVLDWVSGWGQTPRGRIYRVTPNSELGTRNSELVAETRRLLADGMTQRGEKELLELLGHADRRVRLEAQWELAGRGTNSFNGLLSVAKDGKNQFARIHALWATGQIARPLTEDQFTGELHSLLPLLVDPDQEIAGQTALVLAEAGLINANEAITGLLQAESMRLQFQALMALAKLHRFHPYRLYRSTGTRLADHLREKSDALGQVAERLADRPYQATSWAEVRSLLAEPGKSDPFIQHAATLVLIRASRGVSEHHDFPGEAIRDDNPAVRQVALLELRRGTNSTLTNFLSDPDPRLIVAAGRAIHDVPIAEGFPALASFITKIDCPTNLYSRVIDACFRLGTQQHAQMLASFAAREDVPDFARVLAVRALADWARPGPLDRVNGLWRPLVNVERGVGSAESANPTREGNETSTGAAGNSALRLPHSAFAKNLGRAAELPILLSDLGRSVPYAEGIAVKRNPTPARRAFLRVAGDLLNPFNLTESGVPAGTREVLPLQIATVEAAAKLGVKEASSPLFAKFADTNTAPELRRAILPALAALKAAQISEAVQLALGQPDPYLRAAALPWLDRLEGDDAVGLLLRLLPAPDQTLESTNVRVAQAAVAALAQIPGPQADQAVNDLLDRFRTGTLPPALQLDVLSSAQARASRSPAVAERLAPSQPKEIAGDPLAKWRPMLMGGEVSRGKDIFFNNATVQCLRCHKIGNDGGTVGPNLSDVGRRYPREYLLESIVSPNARIGAGFENVVVTLKNGESHAGLVKRETDNTLVLELADAETGTTRTLPLRKNEIERRERGLSAMPEGLADQLTPFELRDVIEYLAALK